MLSSTKSSFFSSEVFYRIFLESTRFLPTGCFCLAVLNYAFLMAAAFRMTAKINFTPYWLNTSASLVLTGLMFEVIEKVLIQHFKIICLRASTSTKL